MGERSRIGWTDHTWNPWRGCKDVSPGCERCYAWVGAKRNPAVLGRWGSPEEGGTRILASPKTFLAPLEWNAKARAAGVRHRVFCNSISDVFEDWRGPILNSVGEVVGLDPGAGDSGDERRRCYPFLAKTDQPNRRKLTPVAIDMVREVMFGIIAMCPDLDFLVLTKRIERVASVADHMCWPDTGSTMFGSDYFLAKEWRHVKIGCTVEDQEHADKRLYHLLAIPSTVRWVSYEPALGPVDWTCIQYDSTVEFNALNGDHGVRRPLAGRSDSKIGWLIVGGESGGKSGELAARPFDIQWARDSIRQCREHGVPVFVKQFGSNPVLDGEPLHLAHRKGEVESEWPSGYRFQEFYRS